MARAAHPLDLLRLLHDSFPPEIVERIFGWYAIAWIGADNRLPLLQPEEDLHQAASSLLEKFTLPMVRSQSFSGAQLTDDDHDFVKLCLEKAKVAILQSITIQLPEVSDMEQPGNVLSSFPLQDRAGYLRHVDLHADITFVAPTLSAEDLAGLCQVFADLLILEQCYPRLQSITVALNFQFQRGNRLLQVLGPITFTAQGEAERFTRLALLVSGLAADMARLRCKNVNLSVRPTTADASEQHPTYRDVVPPVLLQKLKLRFEVIMLLLQAERRTDWKVDDRE